SRTPAPPGATEPLKSQRTSGAASIEPSMLLSLTGSIITAYVSKTEVSLTELPRVIETVYRTLAAVGRKYELKKEPAIPKGESITYHYLVCLEDGQKVAMLRRHLRRVHDMSPEEYRARWDLPGNYPMVAEAYSRLRSEVAKESGLGTYHQHVRQMT